MPTELRRAGADPNIPPVGIVGVSSADSVTVRVRGDLNGDGVIQTTEPSEDVTYSYVAATGVPSRNPGSGVQEVLTCTRFEYGPVTAMGVSPPRTSPSSSQLAELPPSP